MVGTRVVQRNGDSLEVVEKMMPGTFVRRRTRRVYRKHSTRKCRRARLSYRESLPRYDKIPKNMIFRREYSTALMPGAYMLKILRLDSIRLDSIARTCTRARARVTSLGRGRVSDRVQNDNDSGTRMSRSISSTLVLDSKAYS